MLKGSDTLLVVDGITGLGTTHFDVDGWGVDVLIGGSQKAVMIPPGLAYVRQRASVAAHGIDVDIRASTSICAKSGSRRLRVSRRIRRPLR